MVCGSVSKISTERTRTDAGRFTLRVRTDTRRVRGKSLVMDRRGHRQPTDTDRLFGWTRANQSDTRYACQESVGRRSTSDRFVPDVRIRDGNEPKIWIHVRFGFFFDKGSGSVRF